MFTTQAHNREESEFHLALSVGTHDHVLLKPYSFIMIIIHPPWRGMERMPSLATRDESKEVKQIVVELERDDLTQKLAQLQKEFNALY